MDQKEKELLSELRELASKTKAQPVIQEAILEAEKELEKNPAKLGATVQIPLSVFGKGIPDFIQSCRVFALRGNTKYKVERHPNSCQRVLSLKGVGEIRVFEEGHPWTAKLRSDPDAPVEERWASVAENIWHQPVAGPAGWVTLTFHTASDAEIIDEFKE